jgi:hypothetical protein
MSRIVSSQPLAAIRAKFQRAQEHVQALDASVRAFLASTSFVLNHRTEPDQRAAYFVSAVPETPTAWAPMVGDALQNFRGALDYLACALVRANKQTPGTQTYFPVTGDATTYAKDSPGKTKGMSPAAKAALDTLVPYKGGNDDLWKLHRLSIEDKHRALVPVVAAVRSVNMLPSMIQMVEHESNPIFARMAAGMKQMEPLHLRPKDYVLKAGEPIFIDRAGAAPIAEGFVRFEIALDVSGVVEGEEFISTFRAIAKTVDAAIVALETHT